MEIKIFITTVCVLCSVAWSGQAQKVTEKSYRVPDRVYPVIPSQDSLKVWCTINYEDIERVIKKTLDDVDRYYLKEELFSGWAYQIFPDNKHKYRYTNYKEGLLMRQVAYYEDGSIDLDFNMKEGRGFGTQRMWKEDGSLYIDNFYISPGVLHGLQLAWYRNGQLSRKASYDRGTLLYEYKYDINGQILSETDNTKN